MTVALETKGASTIVKDATSREARGRRHFSAGYAD